MSENVDEPAKSKDFSALFDSYSQLFVVENEGEIKFRNIVKWFNQAGLFELECEITQEEIAIIYIGLFKNKPSLNQGEFESLLGSLADQKGLEKKFLLDKLIAAGEPKMSDFAEVVSKTC
ncbi:uncharacterized protein CDAR_611961 [Caerostris darwini]|uniref:Uncharacterized protein n=1 Tax=Caerostris darwini TaxID=1538125 RepID=A0AAV4MSH3_9ARAC|nr:uncharacterized protein CDAR_611961 [Caerostris darwini]